MRLQIAFDMVSIEEALEMAEKIHDIIDIVEIGTPMIIKYGMDDMKTAEICVFCGIRAIF